MANYRYKTAEIEAMKKDILTHCECETSPDRNGNKSAWRLRLILEGMAMCCRCSKREEARRYRKLALFERLTANDMPNWQTEPTQPQIVKVEIVRDFDGGYYANLTDANGSNHALSAEYVSYNKLKSLCRAEYGVELPNRSSLKFEKHGRKEFAYYTPQSTEAPQISTETAEATNVSGEGEKREKRHISELIKEKKEYIESIKNESLHTVKENDGKWHTYYLGKDLGVNLDYVQISHIPAATLEKEYAELKEMYDYMYYLNVIHISATECYLEEVRENIKAAKKRNAEIPRLAITQSEPIEKLEHLPQPPKLAPQSRKTLPAANYATPTPKAREIARKRHCRRLGANGYVMLDETAATLAAINTPQHLTANSPPIGRPHRTLTSGNIKRIY